MTISPDFSSHVNALPEPLHAPLGALLAELAAIFEMGEVTPASFASAENELISSVIAFGRDSILALARKADPTSPVIHVDGQKYQRLKETTRPVFTPFGSGSVKRSLYRKVGVRNGPTIDPVTLRCGLVKRATPRAGSLYSAFIASVPSREASKLLQQLKIQTSRSSLDRIAQAFGERFEDHREELDTVLIEDFVIPEEAVAVSVSVDRVSVPIEKPKPRGPGRPRRGTAKRPIEVVYQMAYVFCWTLYDDQKRPIYTARGGEMPRDGADYEVEERLGWDLRHLVAQRPDLRVVLLSDGAPEMIRILRYAAEGLDVELQLVDMWHALEYIADAADSVTRNVQVEIARAKKDLLDHDDGAKRVYRRLNRWKKARKTERQRVPRKLGAAIRYIKNKMDAGLMDYARAHRAKLPIGSGTVEATAKTLVSIRMKRAGSRWKLMSGQHVLTLRSYLLSDRWDDVTSWHVAKNDNQMPAIRDVA